jgi:CubicO group peptidase (beta-lactamase class C family)
MSPNQDRLERLVQGIVAAQSAPGVAAAARRPKETIAAAVGVSSTSKATPLSLDDRLPMSCVMKPLVAMACLHLAQRGVLDLDADLAVHFPELAGGAGATAVTPWHLLSHTGGYVEPQEPSARWAYSWEAFTAFFPRRVQAFAPGTVWSYTHTGYAVLARLVERLEGRPIDQVLRDLVLEPLGIALGAPDVRAADDARLAALHVKSPRSGRFEPMRPPRDSGFLRFSISDYTISTRDLLALGLFLAGGSDRVEGGVEAARKRLLEPVVQIPAPVGRGDAERMPSAFGLGIGQYGALHGVNGSFVGSTCALRFDAATGSAAAVALNAWVPQARDRVMNKLASFIAKPRAPHAEPAREALDLAAFEGVYQGLMIGTAGVSITRRGADDYHCQVRRHGAPDLEARLRSGQDGRLEIDEASTGFAIAAVDGRASGGRPMIMVGASAYALDPAA